MSRGVSVIDLFCGVGGLTRGMQDAGLPVLAGVDLDPNCRYPYEANNDHAVFIERDIQHPMLPEILEAIYGRSDLRVLIGCAPCQPFSTHTQKNKASNTTGVKNLLYTFADMVRAVQADVISMENVARVMQQVQFKDFVQYLQNLGFHVWAKSVNCMGYGVPQIRRRLVLLASKLGPIELFPPTHQEHKTVRDTISHLEPIPAGGISGIDPLHRARGLSALNMKRMQHSEPGGTWLDWDEEMRVKCHQRSSGQSYTSVYTRMTWDAPAPTITTQFHSFGTGRFGHPEQHRALSLREGALLQTFPHDYKFVDPRLDGNAISMTKVGIQIGNAVPVRLAQAVGQSILGHLAEHGIAPTQPEVLSEQV
jgi:DNA (cytosine-5)-methyltransferase 1